MPSDPASSPPRPAAFAEPRRLHPASIILGVKLGQAMQALLPAFAIIAAGGVVTLGILTLVGVASLGARVLAWQRFRFSFDGAVLRVESGILSRSQRSLDVARIQQVEIERGPLPRLLGLAALRVETAGSASEPEVELRVLPDADAVALRDAIRASKADLGGTDAATAETSARARPVLEVPLRDIVLSSVTGARLLVLPALIAGAFQIVGQQFEQVVDQRIDAFVDEGIVVPGRNLVVGPDWRFITFAAVALLVLSLAAAIAVGILRDGNFRIERVGDDLHVRRGIGAIKESTVPLGRLQLVELNRNWVRRLFRVGTVRIRSAGGSAGGEGRLTVPLVHDRDVDTLLTELLAGVPGVPPLTAHPPAARRRALVRWLRPSLIAVAAVWSASVLFPIEVALLDRLRWLVLALVPISAGLALIEYGQLAHALTPYLAVSRRGALSVTTTLAPVVKIQAVTSRRNPFQRRLGLTTLVAHVAGPGALLEVLDADVTDAAELHARLTEHAATPVAAAAATPARP